MCYSERASWGAFAFGASGMAAFVSERLHQRLHQRRHVSNPSALVPYSEETVILALGFGALVVMQLYEALMWRHQRLGIRSDRTIERVAMITNVLQPIVVGLLIVRACQRHVWPTVFATEGAPRGRPTSLAVPIWQRVGLLLALLLWIAYTASATIGVVTRYHRLAPAAPIDCDTTKTVCRLDWSWTEGALNFGSMHWWLYLVLLTVGLCVIDDKWTRIATIVISLGALVISTWFLGPPIGSKWCFLAVVLPWAVYAVTRWQRRRAP